MTSTLQKRCGRCETLKDIGEFGMNKAEPDGFDRYRKPCRLSYARARREFVKGRKP